uniref:Putative endodeoxyribonuclease n=1 Tax=viral metagenome TaxID=1070528 RepID=A0A6M3JI82_9ZZZZ
MHLSFFVPGTPRPKGSKRGFVIRRKNGTHGVAMVESSGDNLTTWIRLVRAAAQEARFQAQAWRAISTGPVRLGLRFWFRRPKSHYGSGRNANTLKPTAPMKHTIRPDFDKLDRAIGDALQGILWQDDAQIYERIPVEGKYYCGPDEREGAQIVADWERPERA